MYSDADYMRLAIDQARLCKAEDEQPRPKVGAVLVRDGQMLGKAYRGELAPGDHAEFTLLEKKSKSEVLAHSTLYTTLEPCTQRNSKQKVPCADRIIERRITHVKIGMLDPNQSICGRGIRRLRDAGIKTDLFPSELMAEVEEQNRDFTRDQEALSANYPTSTLPLVNPHYEFDSAHLDVTWKIDSVLGKETVLIVTGENLVVELLDRTPAAMLRDAIDQRGGNKPFRRAIIITSALLRNQPTLSSQAVISVGGPNANETTKEIITLAESKGHKKWEANESFGIFVRDGMPRVALWGHGSAAGTRRAVENYIESPDGLKKFLPMVWG
jgi:pyrimidine deaminase RibD-like protein